MTDLGSTGQDKVRERLAEIAATADAATEGPWSAADEHELLEGADAAWCVSRMRPGYESMSETEGYLYDVAYTTGTNEASDAEFIAMARSSLPALVAALTAVLDRHQPEPMFEICNHTDNTEGGIAEHAWEISDGDWVCGPTIGERCASCRDTDGSDIDWPCAEYCDLAAGLGVTP